MNVVKKSHWVLVADSGHARIFELSRAPAQFREVKKLVSDSQHLTNRDMVSDTSGSRLRSQGPASHAMQQRSDPHELAEEAFCRKLAGLLERAERSHAFDHLAIIADPRTLGRIRPNLKKSLSDRVVLELGRDLVDLPVISIEQRVRSELGWPV